MTCVYRGRRAGLALPLFVLIACGGGDKPAEDAAAAAAAAGAASATTFTGQPVTLSEKDMEGFLTVMREFKRLGLETRRTGEDPMSSLNAMASAWGANREAMEILRANDFDVPRFQSVTYGVMLAATAASMEGKNTNADAAKQLEALKTTVPAAQYEAMKKTLLQAKQITDDMSKQPAGNIELVKRFKSELDALN